MEASQNLQKISYRLCPICKNELVRKLRTMHFLVAENSCAPGEYDVVSCSGCGFVYADVKSNQENFDTYYTVNSKYETQSLASGSGEKAHDQARLNEVASAIVASCPNKQAAILDVGCVNGGLLKILRERGYTDLTGLDPSPACVGAVEAAGFKGVRGVIAAGVVTRQYDCIVLSHVLEHVRDIKESLSILLSWLKEDGILYIETPDASRYKDYFIVPFYYFDTEHINHFDKHSLINLLAQERLTVLSVGEKVIPVADDQPYPAVFVVAKKQIQPASTSLVYNSAVARSIEEHIEQSKKTAANHELEKIAETQEEIVVWGAGNQTARNLSAGPLGKCRIKYFIDEDARKQGTRINGAPVVSSATLGDFKGPVVLSVVLHRLEILDAIKKRGLPNRIIIV